MSAEAAPVALEYGLLPEVVERIRAVLANYPQIDTALLYGSRAKGNHQPGSDIDLTLQGPGLTVAMMLAIENVLDDLLLPYKIDLSLHAHINNDALRHHIARCGLSFYRRPNR